MSANLVHFCGVPLLGPLSEADKKRLASHRAALLDGAKWAPGSVITVRFLEGDAELHGRVRAVAEEWMEVAGLTFDFRNDGPTDIRIAFMEGKGSWAYLGTQCRQIPEPAATMNFGWLTTPETTDAELRSVVLHEFGHAIGMIHEHQNPKQPIQWDRDAVIADLSGPPNNWDEATIENNMFKRYEGLVTSTPVDSKSIMMYPIPKAWTLDETIAGFNSELSQTDKDFIAQAYPKQ